MSQPVQSATLLMNATKTTLGSCDRKEGGEWAGAVVTFPNATIPGQSSRKKKVCYLQQEPCKLRTQTI